MFYIVVATLRNSWRTSKLAIQKNNKAGADLNEIENSARARQRCRGPVAKGMYQSHVIDEWKLDVTKVFIGQLDECRGMSMCPFMCAKEDVGIMKKKIELKKMKEEDEAARECWRAVQDCEEEMWQA
jgi:hypothetical protein